MSETLRFGVGLLTTIVFLGIGLTLIGEPNSQRIGAVLAGLGVLRGAMLAKQFIDSRSDDDDEGPTG
jgi:uncharacterized RDD family membrane protein YckC